MFRKSKLMILFKHVKSLPYSILHEWGESLENKVFHLPGLPHLSNSTASFSLPHPILPHPRVLRIDYLLCPPDKSSVSHHLQVLLQVTTLCCHPSNHWSQLAFPELLGYLPCAHLSQDRGPSLFSFSPLLDQAALKGRRSAFPLPSTKQEPIHYWAEDSVEVTDLWNWLLRALISNVAAASSLVTVIRGTQICYMYTIASSSYKRETREKHRLLKFKDHSNAYLGQKVTSLLCPNSHTQIMTTVSSLVFGCGSSPTPPFPFGPNNLDNALYQREITTRDPEDLASW